MHTHTHTHMHTHIRIAALPSMLRTVMTDVEALKKAMGGGKPSEASKAYAASTESLNVYLDAVDLPALGDARYSDPSTACFFKCDE